MLLSIHDSLFPSSPSLGSLDLLWFLHFVFLLLLILCYWGGVDPLYLNLVSRAFLLCLHLYTVMLLIYIPACIHLTSCTALQWIVVVVVVSSKSRSGEVHYHAHCTTEKQNKQTFKSNRGGIVIVFISIIIIIVIVIKTLIGVTSLFGSSRALHIYCIHDVKFMALLYNCLVVSRF